jgi:PAS domain S-box-containing protein
LPAAPQPTRSPPNPPTTEGLAVPDAPTTADNALAFLNADSETGRLIAAHDWGATALGPIATWPQSVKSTVALILRSHVPMVTMWGEDGVMVYNDGYAVIAGGRHPALLGAHVREGWPEASDFNDQVMRATLAGGTLAYRDQEFTLFRHGRAEQVWLDLDYSPLFDEANRAVGAIAIVQETTQKVQAQRWLQGERQRLRSMFEQAPGFMAMLTGPEHRFELANPGYLELIGRRDVLGRTVREALPDAVEQGYLGLLDKVFREGKAYAAQGALYTVQVDPAAPPVGRHVDFVLQPLFGSGGEVIGIFVQGSDVSARVAAESAQRAGEVQLREGALQLQRAQAAGGVGVFSVDLDDSTVYGTPEFCRIFGLTPRERIPAQELERLVLPEDVHLVSDSARRQAGTALLDVEYRIRRADTGEERTISRRAEFGFDAQGRRKHMAGVVQDVTERRRVLRELEQSERRFRALAQAMPNQAWLAQPDGLLDWFNDQVYAYSGARPGGLDGHRWSEMVFAADLPQAQARWAASLASGEPYEVEFRLRRADGEYRWHLARAIPVRGEDDRVIHWIGTNTDIHEQKTAEVEHALERNRLWSMSQDLLLVCDFEGRITAINPSSQRMLGWTEDDMVGHLLADFIHPDDLRSSLDEVGKLAQGETTLAFENRYRAKDGSYRLLDWTAVPDAGRIHAVGRDITDERAIALNQERIWTLSPVLKIVAAADGRLSTANPAWIQVLGWSLAQTEGRMLLDFVVADAVPAVREALVRLAAGERVAEQQFAMIASDGGARQIVWTIVGESGVLYGFGRDVTEQRAAEDALRQSQKMEAVGQLTGGIAHDFNNLLQGITGSLDLVQKRIAQGRLDELDRFVRGAVGSAKRAAALTHRLLAFSRRQPLDPRAVRANPLVASMEDLLRRTLGERIELELVLAGGLWLTRCDPNQLESAILNLAINARDAMPHGGRLVIETCNAHLDSAYAARQRDVRPGQYVCICVTDTGTGMSADTVAKAFEPFFTTKPIGQGTGLGLSMIYGFARQSEGYAKIYSEVGHGTTFKLYLPRHRGEAPDDEPLAELTEAHVTLHGETVLVVEDEAVVRGLIVEVLGDLGYRAIEAADGPAGLELLQSRARIDLLITDIGLPGLNGRQIAEAGRQVRPGLKVLFMTGYAENAAIASGFLEPGMSMITKPFAMEALATRIREIIEAPPD